MTGPKPTRRTSRLAAHFRLAVLVAVMAGGTWSASPAAAAPPTVHGKLPSDGAWVRYKLSWSWASQNANQQQAPTPLCELTVRSVEREQHGGLWYRQLEINYVPSDDLVKLGADSEVFNHNHDLKILMLEEGLEDSRRFPEWINLFTRSGKNGLYVFTGKRGEIADDEPPAAFSLAIQFLALFDDCLLQSKPTELDQFLMNFEIARQVGILSAQYPKPPFRVGKQKAVIETPHGPKDGWKVTIAGDLEILKEPPVFKLAPNDEWGKGMGREILTEFVLPQFVGAEVSVVPDIPFGIVSLKVPIRIPRISMTNQDSTEFSPFGTVELQLLDHGTGAKPLLPSADEYEKLAAESQAKIIANAEQSQQQKKERRKRNEQNRQALTKVNAAIQKATRKPIGKVTVADRQKIKQLKFSSINLETLDPLAQLTGLEELFLHKNNISDLTPLAGLTNLQKLVLNDNKIEDLTPLSKLTRLQELYVRDNPDLTKVEIDKLQQALPNCKIIHNAKQ